jgi:L-threonylcarbamoyladenylate synthase
MVMAMKILQWDDHQHDSISRSVAKTIQEGGLVCLPCNGRYRLLADLTSADAVGRLVQSKGRVRRAPALVFIDSVKALHQVAGSVEPAAIKVARQLWPGPLTIRVALTSDLPDKVRKLLGGGKGRIGVRVPADPLLRQILRSCGRPLLVSSANRERKTGDSSPAQVRKNFATTVDLFLDRGDLTPGPRSTVIDIRDGELVVERAGLVTEERLRELFGT